MLELGVGRWALNTFMFRELELAPRGKICFTLKLTFCHSELTLHSRNTTVFKGLIEHFVFNEQVLTFPSG